MAGYGRQRQEIKDEEEGEGNKGVCEGIFVLRSKGLSLDREEKDVTDRQMAVYKGERGNPVLARLD